MRPLTYSLLLASFACQWLFITAVVSPPFNQRPVRPPRPCLLPRLQNGGFKLVRNGKMLKFKCNTGYLMIGDKINECVANRWDLDIPICIKPGCPLLSPPANGLLQYMHQSASAVLFCNQNYMIAGSVMSYCNGTHWDRTIGTCRAVETKSSPFCDFETENICGWFHDTEDDFDFIRANGYDNKTVRISTGPQADHTIGRPLEGHYMVINTKSQSYMKKARLISPFFDASKSDDSCLRFYYHMYGQSVGTLRAYMAPMNMSLKEVIGEDDQEHDYLLFEQMGSKSNDWHEGLVSIKKVDSKFQIIFEAVCGQTRLSDIAIDDVTILTNKECFPSYTTGLMDEVTESESILTIQSCADRCQEAAPKKRGRGPINHQVQCDCDKGCISVGTCCPDYVDVCDEPDDVTKSVSTVILDYDVIIPEKRVFDDTPEVVPSATPTPRAVFHWWLLIFSVVAISASALVTVCARHAIRQYKIATDPMNYKNKMDDTKISAAPECSEVRYLTGGEDVELDFSLATPDTITPDDEV